MAAETHGKDELSCQVEHVSLKFIQQVNQNICCLQVVSNVMFIALRTGYIFIIDLDDPATVHSFIVPILVNNQEKLLHLWVNPKGSVALVKSNFAKYYLVHIGAILNASADSAKLTFMKKLTKKSCDIRTVDWSFAESELLVGTKEGKAYHVNLAPCLRNTSDDAHVSRIFSASSSIDGIFYSKVYGAILIAGSQIMYWDRNVTKNNNVVDTFANVVPTSREEYEKMDKDLGCKFTVMDSKFAWVTQSGVVLGDMNDKKVLSNAKVLLYIELPESAQKVKDVRLTSYHVLILRGSEIMVVNQFTMKVVFQESIFNSIEGEKLLALSVDSSQYPPTVWCHSGSNVYEIVMKGEGKSVWKTLCDNLRFEEALALQDISSLHRDYIHTLYGDYYYDQKNWGKAAEQYSRIEVLNSTGPMALKFMEDPEQLGSLQLLLRNNLKNTKADCQVKQVILSSWIVQNTMNQLNEIDEEINRNPLKETLKEEKKRMVEEFERFATESFNMFDRETIYQIISRQNRKKELLFVANLAKDYEYVLSYWIKTENWYEALKLLLSLQDPELNYKYSNILLISCPDATINTWMKLDCLDPVSLIPAILSYFSNYQRKKAEGVRPTAQNHGANFLRWCIREKHNNSPIIHNTFLYMMLVDQTSDKDKEIIQFLTIHSQSYYDKDFILRLSLRYARYAVAICLYSELSLYEEAVMLALEHSMLQEAKTVASTVSNVELKKLLWLKIASVVVGENKDIKNTLTLLIQESENILSIKDLLPLFDEFVTVANIKEELVRGLEKHSLQVTRLSQDIRDSLKIKSEIKSDIVLFKNRYEALEPGAACSYCGKPLQTRKFFVFPCGHSINTDCIIKLILSSNQYALKAKIQAMQKRLLKDKHSVKPEELEELLGAQCPLCSEISVNSIDEPWEVDPNTVAKWKI